MYCEMLDMDNLYICVRQLNFLQYKHREMLAEKVSPLQEVDFSHLKVQLTLGPVVAPFLRSGMSALLGLLALPSSGLAGGAPLRLPGVPGLRSWTPPSSFALLSDVVV